jgi:hypothetical protein
VFGLQINLPTDIKIKIIKFLAISPIHLSTKLHGKWDGQVVLILIIQIVKHTQLTQLHHNLIQQWLLVLKTLDHLWLIKLKAYSKELLLSQNHIAVPLLGIHVECAKMEQF